MTGLSDDLFEAWFFLFGLWLLDLVDLLDFDRYCLLLSIDLCLKDFFESKLFNFLELSIRS